MTEFELKLGMKDKELWQVLDKVGISGETRQEVIQFKRPQKGHEQQSDLPLHNVIMCNDKYVIIRKISTITDQFHFVIESPEYFWCGINDEGTYFIRPLEDLPNFPELTIEKIVAWVNRYDEGFSDRVQGDVLIKFVAKEQPKKKESIVERAINTFNPQPNSLEESFLHSNRRLAPGLFGLTLGSTQRSIGSSIVEIDDQRFRLVNDRPIKLGNHKLWVEGQVYVSETNPYLLVDSSSLVLQHEEHRIKETLIPKGNYAILAPQRGRSFDLSDYLKKAFD